MPSAPEPDVPDADTGKIGPSLPNPGSLVQESEGSSLPSPLEGEGPGVRGRDSPRATGLEQPLPEVLKIRTQEVEKLERLGVRTVEDALYHLPRDHYDCRNPVVCHGNWSVPRRRTTIAWPNSIGVGLVVLWA